MVANNDLGYAEIRKIFNERDRRAAINGTAAKKRNARKFPDDANADGGFFKLRGICLYAAGARSADRKR